MKKIILTLAVVMLSCTTALGGKPAKVIVSTAAPASTAPDDLMPVVKKILDAFREWDKKLNSLVSDFTQTVHFGEAGLDQEVEGKLHYLKPDRLRIEHTKPSRQIIYTDKKILWIYKPQDSQAIQVDWEQWKKTQSSAFSGIMDFGNYSKIIEKHYIFIDSAAVNAEYITLRFVPKNNPELYTLTLSLSATDYFPVETSLTVGKTSIRTVLKKMEKNVKVPASLFDFKPPKGVSVIHLSGGTRK